MLRARSAKMIRLASFPVLLRTGFLTWLCCSARYFSGLLPEVTLVPASLCGGITAEQTDLLYCDPNLASTTIMKLIFTKNISLSLFMKYSLNGSSCGTLLWCEDETKHQSLHSISGSSGTTVFTRSSKHHSVSLTSESEHYIMAGKSSKKCLWCMRFNLPLGGNALLQQWLSSVYGAQFGTQLVEQVEWLKCWAAPV